MSVLICKNIETEGPGTIEEYLRSEKIPYRIVELSKGEVLPDPNNFNTLIIMGGPMSVNETNLYPYIEEEQGLVRDFISKGKKILGICLGAQIMAKALGARVYSGQEKEIGWYDIELTEEGLKDTYMRRLALEPKARNPLRRFPVFHWHGETFDLPEGAVRLAGSELYPNQAFRYNECAYAFQFHIEVTRQMIYEWLEDEPVDIYRMKNDTEKFYNDYHCRAINFYKAFLK
jgi:GMP synthase-like glutamine amidotransferase